jgi:hypothetical protein
MSLLPLSYRVVGQDDYVLEIEVDAAGAFRIDSGDHTSHKPRRGTLSPAQLAGLDDLLRRLGEPREHPAPEGTEGFMAELMVGGGGEGRRYRFWEGALDSDPPLKAAIRAIEVI